MGRNSRHSIPRGLSRTWCRNGHQPHWRLCMSGGSAVGVLCRKAAKGSAMAGSEGWGGSNVRTQICAHGSNRDHLSLRFARVDSGCPQQIWPSSARSTEDARKPLRSPHCNHKYETWSLPDLWAHICTGIFERPPSSIPLTDFLRPTRTRRHIFTFPELPVPRLKSTALCDGLGPLRGGGRVPAPQVVPHSPVFAS